VLLDRRHPRPERLIGHGAAALVSPAARAAGAATIVAAAVLGLASPASAHNSRTAFTGVFGPYDVVASVRYVHEDESGVLLDLLVRTEGSKRTVDDASVAVEARDGARTVGPLDTTRYGDTYRVVLPGGDVDAWEIETTIDGGPGTSTFTRTIPGPRELRADAGGMWDSGHGLGAAWLVATVGVLVVVGAAGLTRWWRPAMWAAGVALLAVCGTALVDHLAAADAPTAARVAALPAPLVAAGLLVAGLVTSRRRDDESLLLVFVGATGLAVLFGWLDQRFLGGGVTSELPQTVARATVSLASGLGGGLALLVVACHRDKLRSLLPAPRRAP
jgi:hypothetical protein